MNLISEKLIFISAQPDQYYFLWQLELLLFNLRGYDIPTKHIHILLGYDSCVGLSADSISFKERHPDVNVCGYPDTRSSSRYLSSIRPHIIAKHFRENPFLECETIFYHDSDIVFSKAPDFESLLSNKVWYASATGNYLNMNYIISNTSRFFFEQMCELMEVEKDVVEANDLHAGGAQYLLKNCTTAFWERAEQDCELLFSFLEGERMKLGFCKANRLVNPWYSDMWVMWWGALREGYIFEVHSDLDFSWADSSIDQWKSKSILHYTGNVDSQGQTLFRKANYSSCTPFFDNFSKIDRNSCSYSLVEIIKEYRHSIFQKRINLADMSFLIVSQIDSVDRLENTIAVTNFLCNHFETKVIVMEVDTSPKITSEDLHPDVEYHFHADGNPKLHRTKYNNKLIEMASTPYISLYDTDVIIPVKQIVDAIELIRKGRYKVVHPFDGSCFGVDILLKAMFIRILDEKFLKENQGKLTLYSKRAVGGCIFLDRAAYQKGGGENENISSWGPDDVERVKRMKILGYEIKRIDGPLYHLHHARKENSGYGNYHDHVRLMEEYLKVTESDQQELTNYIKTWDWLPHDLN